MAGRAGGLWPCSAYTLGTRALLIEFEQNTGESWGLDAGKVHWVTGGGQGEGPGATGVKVSGQIQHDWRSPEEIWGVGRRPRGRLPSGRAPAGSQWCSSEPFLGLGSADVSPHWTLGGLGRSGFLFLD